MRLCFSLWLWWCSCLTLLVQAQSHIAHVQSFTLEDGLSHLEVNSIHKGPQGFMWFGTSYGLNRYDGRTFKVYTKELHGLGSNEVRVVALDKKGFVWLECAFSTETKKIYVFNPRTEKAVLVETHFKSKLPFLLDEYSDVIGHEEQDGKIILLGKEKQTQVHQLFFSDGNDWRSLFCPKDKRIHVTIWPTQAYSHYWIGASLYQEDAPSHNSQFYLIDQVGEVQDSIVEQPSNALLSSTTYKTSFIPFRVDSDGTIYFRQTTHHQTTPPIDYLNLLGEIWKKTPGKPSEKLPLPVGKYFPYNNHFGEIRKDSLIIWNEEGEQLAQAYLNLSPSARIWGRMPVVTDGVIWWTTQGNYPLISIELTPLLFNGILNGEFHQSKLRGIGEDKLGRIYVNRSESNTSLVLEKMGNGEFRRLDSLPLASGLGLCIDKNNCLWSGSWGQELFFKDLTNGRRQVFEQEILPIEGYPVWTVYPYNKEEAWVGLSEGIGRLSLKDSLIRFYEQYNGFDELKKSAVFYFHKNAAGLWVAASSGLYLIDYQKGIQERYYPDGDEENYLPHDVIAHIYEDKEGVFWLATKGGGLIKWNPKTKASEQFTTLHGISHNTLYAVYEDDYGYLWMSSDRGITRFEKATGLTNIFTKKDGITHDEFNTTSHYQAQDGTIYFGGQNGLNIFHPDDFAKLDPRSTAPLRVTEFSKWDTETDEYQNLTQELLTSNTIQMEPSDKAFLIRFALLDYLNSNEHQYAYMIEGFDKKWHYQKENFVRIVGLRYGSYTLKIKAKNARSDWSENFIAIDLHVLRPFYLQVWFLFLSGLSFLIAVFGLFRWRTSQLQQRKDELEDEVKRRTEKIQQQAQEMERRANKIQEQAEKLKALDRVKSRFFTNISHELRTPLTLILGPLSSILDDPDKLTLPMLKKLQIMQRNGKSLLQLIEEILDLSKLESDKLKLEEKTVHFGSYINRIFSAFKSQAAYQHIDYQINNQVDETVSLLIDPNKTQKIINNLLSNAIKFTPREGMVKLSINEQNQTLILQVEDSGQGVHPQDLPNIFNRFYQSSLPERIAQGGTGVGLALSLELARLMQGNIEVESEWGKGSIFRFTLPMKRVAHGQSIAWGETVEETIVDQKLPATDNSAKEFTILVTEDNNDMREFIESLLEENYKVLTAENGLIALDQLKKHQDKIDLILSDVMMPQMDGFNLLKSIKTNPNWRRLPVIMLTARAAQQDKLDALRWGVDDYLTKPFSSQELLARVRNILSNYKERKTWQNQEKSNQEEKNKEKTIAAEPPSTPIAEVDQEWLNELEKIVKDLIVTEDFDVAALAKKLAMSKRQLERRLKKLIGLSPAKYIREIRLQMARQYLERGTYRSVSEVGYAVGFIKIRHFSDLFTDRFGRRPSSYLS